jgi:hypothetical protein
MAFTIVEGQSEAQIRPNLGPYGGGTVRRRATRIPVPDKGQHYTGGSLNRHRLLCSDRYRS